MRIASISTERGQTILLLRIPNALCPVPTGLYLKNLIILSPVYSCDQLRYDTTFGIFRRAGEKCEINLRREWSGKLHPIYWKGVFARRSAKHGAAPSRLARPTPSAANPPVCGHE